MSGQKKAGANRESHPCGCTAGAVALLGALAALAIAQLGFGVRFGSPLRTAVTWVGVAVAAAVVGKVAGSRAARARHRGGDPAAEPAAGDPAPPGG